MKTRYKTGFGINPDWDKQPQEVKKLFLDNLPINRYAFMILTPILFFLLPVINNFFSTPYFKLIHVLILIVYALWLIGSTMYNYKKKTRRHLNEDIEKIRVEGGYYK